MKIIVLTGRILYSFIFLEAILFHFSSRAIDYAALAGVPAASLLVPFAGILAFVGALSIILGYKAKWGAWLIIIFLIPVTFTMHAFWKETDPMHVQIQMTMFMKNISMLGAAFIISFFGSGPFSIDQKKPEMKSEQANLVTPQNN